jgi:hypothetical protein
MAVRAWIIGLAAAAVACGGGGSADGGLPDGTVSDGPNNNDTGNNNQCTCPMPDAALLAPSQCCAGGSCVAMHSDGLGHSFYDCYGVGSFVTPLAMDACRAYFDASSPCSATMCGVQEVVEGMGTKCVVWTYQGADTTAWGHVHEDTTCVCPDAGDPSWY